MPKSYIVVADGENLLSEHRTEVEAQIRMTREFMEIMDSFHLNGIQPQSSKLDKSAEIRYGNHYRKLQVLGTY